MKEFNFYDTAGVIAPGMVVLFGGALLLFPGFKFADILSGLSAGGLGVLLIASYVGGQLIQSIGSYIDKTWWLLWGGMPTDWIRSSKHALLSKMQRECLEAKVKSVLGLPGFRLQASILTEKDWSVITRQVYAAVAAEKRNERIDTFNGIYGLCRGIAVAMLILLGGYLLVDFQDWKTELALSVLLILALSRMHHFGIAYGRELMVQFLQLPTPQRTEQKK